MDMRTDTSNKMQLILHRSIRKILRPLVRLMLSQGINYTMVIEELKRVFISVAEEEFKIEGKAQTNSRITLLTGIHRRDVQRIREDKNSDIDAPPSISAQIFGLWLSKNEYLDDLGQPLPLPKNSSKGEVSFESLVASISKDFRARSVLDEWLRLGFVSIDNDDCVRLNIQAFIPNQDLEYKLSFLALNSHDHMSAAVSNLNSQNEPLLERCVYYDGLTAENVEVLHTLAKQHGMRAIRRINRHAAALKASQSETTKTTRRESDKANKRMNFGIYFYHTSDDKKSPDEDS
jgi:Family of unknown function (DUF6502)